MMVVVMFCRVLFLGIGYVIDSGIWILSLQWIDQRSRSSRSAFLFNLVWIWHDIRIHLIEFTI